jgi:hypothetical protein
MSAWTYSSLEKYLTCPRQYFHLRVLKDVKDLPSEQTIWGEKVHEAFELAVKLDTSLPKEMQGWESFLNKIKAIKGDKFTEIKLAVNKHFAPCDWDNAWSRGIVDLLVVSGNTAIVADYKTGKRKLSDQLSLYAAYVFAHYPEVQTVHTAFVWLKDKKIDRDVLTRSDISKIWLQFIPTTLKIEHSQESNKWPAKPSGLCKQWCHVLQCEHNGKT